jgi:hypothetical protein
VDADDIRVAEDFDESLLHRTPEIDGFLTPDRDDKFIVIGTKGFGKTLLLKAKRILYQREARAACLPTGNLLDKPIGDKIFGSEALTFFAASTLPWSKLWLTAISAAALKHTGAATGLQVGSKLTSLMADAQLHGVIDHFVRLLDFTPSELQRAATDTDGHLVPRLRAIKTPLAIFIDGVDEYFNKHVESVGTPPSVTGQLSPNVWSRLPISSGGSTTTSRYSRRCARKPMRACLSAPPCPSSTGAVRSTSCIRPRASARSSSTISGS